jgi:uncharacterized YccA/Bax inhibitor family protein
MRIGRSTNPALSQKRFASVDFTATDSAEVMTVNGALNKTFILFALLIASSVLSWNTVVSGTASSSLLIFSVIGGLVLAFATIFKPQWAPYTAPAYALVEGVLVGAVSAMYAKFYDGIVFTAVGLTLSVLFLMLVLYKTGVLKATPKFKKGVIIATGGVFFFYILNMIFSLFGGGISLFNLGIVGVLIQLVIVGVASMNLILDFDSVEKGAEQGMPKFMEWYSGFGIMITLVWLYFEMLRLVALLSGRN